jgi:hypothetical protein
MPAQASGTVIAVARIPVPRSPYLGTTLITDTSTATQPLWRLGNAANGNSAIYKAAAVFTTTDTPTRFGLTSTVGVPVLSGIDSQGLPTTYGSAQNGGGGYEDIILTVGTATRAGIGHPAHHHPLSAAVTKGPARGSTPRAG